MMKFLAFDIGCIECGQDSAVVGLFDTREAAEAAIRDYLDGGSRWGRTGWYGRDTNSQGPVGLDVIEHVVRLAAILPQRQHSVEIFEVTA